ncbi:MAG: hypothetical protein N2746_05625 [Deltaproteobacteria bacterium]|nr:hypothetical protein [Deltaproteobacteria bacterium]
MNKQRHLSKFWSVLFIFFSTFIITYFNHFHKDWPNPNETVRLYLTLAISDRGDFNIDKEINQFGVIWDRAVYKNKIYSDKAPGISFAAVPVIYINKLFHKYVLKKSPSLKTNYMLAVLSTSTLSTIISLVFLIQLFSLYEFSLTTTMLALFSLILGTYTNTYSMLFFGHQFASALLFISFVLVEMYIRKDRKPIYIISAAFLASYAFISEYPTILISMLIFVYLFVEVREKKILIYSISALIPVLLLMHYFNSCFGSIFSTGYQHLDSETFSRIHKEGILGFKYPDPKALLGLLFGSQRGLLFFSPIFLLSILYLLKSKKLRAIKFIMVTFCSYTLLISSFGYWIGGDAAGARHLIPLNYFLIIPLAFFIEEKRRNPLVMSFFFGLLFISAHNVIVTNLSWPFFPPQFLNPLADFAYILINDGYITNSVLNVFNIYGYSVVGVFLCILLFVLILTLLFVIKDFFNGYLIILQMVMIWILCLLILFPTRPDESNYREIKRIESSFDPRPTKSLPFERYVKGDYKICLKRGNVLVKRGNNVEAIREYRCMR